MCRSEYSVASVPATAHRPARTYGAPRDRPAGGTAAAVSTTQAAVFYATSPGTWWVKMAHSRGAKISQPPLSFRNGVLGGRGLRCGERVCLGLFVERFGGQVDAAGPYEGSSLRIDGDLGEVCGVVQRRQDAGPWFSGKSSSRGRGAGSTSSGGGRNSVSSSGSLSCSKETYGSSPSVLYSSVSSSVSRAWKARVTASASACPAAISCSRAACRSCPACSRAPLAASLASCLAHASTACIDTKRRYAAATAVTWRRASTRHLNALSAADADVGQVAAKCGLNLSGSAACCTLWE